MKDAARRGGTREKLGPRRGADHEHTLMITAVGALDGTIKDLPHESLPSPGRSARWDFGAIESPGRRAIFWLFRRTKKQKKEVTKTGGT